MKKDGLGFIIVLPPVIASDSEATQCSVPRTLGCFAIARNDSSTISGEMMAEVKKIRQFSQKNKTDYTHIQF